jgi:hypothetical protein
MLDIYFYKKENIFYCHKACKILVVSRCWGDVYTFLPDIIVLSSFYGTFSETIQHLKENCMGASEKYLWVIVLNICPQSWNYIHNFSVSNYMTFKLEQIVKEQKSVGITKFKMKKKIHPEIKV